MKTLILIIIAILLLIYKLNSQTFTTDDIVSTDTIAATSQSSRVVYFSFKDSSITGVDTLMTGQMQVIRMKPRYTLHTQEIPERSFKDFAIPAILILMVIILICGVARAVKNAMDSPAGVTFHNYRAEEINELGKEIGAKEIELHNQRNGFLGAIFDNGLKPAVTKPQRTEPCTSCAQHGKNTYKVIDEYDVCTWCGREYEREEERTEYYNESGKLYDVKVRQYEYLNWGTMPHKIKGRKF